MSDQPVGPNVPPLPPRLPPRPSQAPLTVLDLPLQPSAGSQPTEIIAESQNQIIPPSLPSRRDASPTGVHQVDAIDPERSLGTSTNILDDAAILQKAAASDKLHSSGERPLEALLDSEDPSVPREAGLEVPSAGVTHEAMLERRNNRVATAEGERDPGLQSGASNNELARSNGQPEVSQIDSTRLEHVRSTETPTREIEIPTAAEQRQPTQIASTFPAPTTSQEHDTHPVPSSPPPPPLPPRKSGIAYVSSTSASDGMGDDAPATNPSNTTSPSKMAKLSASISHGAPPEPTFAPDSSDTKSSFPSVHLPEVLHKIFQYAYLQAVLPVAILLLGWILPRTRMGTVFLLVIVSLMAVVGFEVGKEQAIKKESEEARRARLKGNSRHDVKAKEESVEWMNHALRALFPVISTDLLTPFIDLLEDAMISQLPPVVSSARLDAPSLGEEPIRIVSMRALSDEEWFENLSRAPDAPANANERPFQDTVSDKNKLHPISPRHSRSRSNTSASSTSAKSQETGYRLREAQIRSQRAGVVRRIGGRRDRALNQVHSDLESGSELPSAEKDPDIPEDNPTGADEAEEGQYVNYAIDFAFDGSKNRPGWTLNFKAYFGVGLKGVGGTEIQLPEFDFSAKAINDISPDFMTLPFVKPFIQKTIRQVADAFVRPNSYCLDLDRLILGHEGRYRTHAIGVLHIRVHSAFGLAKADTFGSSDPYCVISLTKYSRPLFSTRTIVDSLNPRWEEDAYLLISAEAIENGENVRLTVFDSDKFSADDTMGMVEVDLSQLLDISADEYGKSDIKSRNDALRPRRSGMKCQGVLSWSWSFHPIWKKPRQDKTSQQAIQNREQKDATDVGTGRRSSNRQSGLIYRLLEGLKPEPFPWQEDRRRKRLESVAWLTGERAMEIEEATDPPSLDRRSGVLQFTVIQCHGLEMQQLKGTYSSVSKKSLKGAAGGKAAIESVIDSEAWEAKHPPSPYCEVILNGRLIFRTRTKQLSPSPYWNATAERFIRDWSKARIVFVIRNEKEREKDPVIGLAAFELRTLFRQSCQIIRTFPIVAGLGWGQIRLSFLWKAVEMKLPPGISGYELATVTLDSVSIDNRHFPDADKICLEIVSDADHLRLEGPVQTSRPVDRAGPGAGTPQIEQKDVAVLDWSQAIRRVGLRPIAVEYRHSCSLLLRLTQDKGSLKKDVVIGYAVIKLSELEDNAEWEGDVPIYLTESVNEACYKNMDRLDALSKGRPDPDAKRPQVHIKLRLRAGMSRAHKRVAKRDRRFAHVYEAWELASGVGTTEDAREAKERRKIVREMMTGGENEDEDDGTTADGLIDSSQEEKEDAEKLGISPSSASRSRRSTSTSSHPSQWLDENEDEDIEEDGDLSTRSSPSSSRWRRFRDHSKALHKYNQGVMSHPIARTMAMGKSKVEETFYRSKDRLTGRSEAEKARSRRRGADVEVEMEGISTL